MISCRTTSSNARPILESILRLEVEFSLLTWYARVPTFSNVADGPSRGDAKFLTDVGGVHDVIRVAELFGDVALLDLGHVRG